MKVSTMIVLSIMHMTLLPTHFAILTIEIVLKASRKLAADLEYLQ